MLKRPTYKALVKNLIVCFVLFFLAYILIIPAAVLEMTGAVLGLGFILLAVKGWGFLVLFYGVVRLSLDLATEADSWDSKCKKVKPTRFDK